MKEILSGERDFPNDSVVIIDSRHKFEYSGGHIKVRLALNCTRFPVRLPVPLFPFNSVDLVQWDHLY